jgi:hypothetical protein
MLRVEQLPPAYELLRTLPTLRRLPHADAVLFEVGVDRDVFGKVYPGPEPRIIISARRHRHVGSWLMTLAHEMVHMRLYGDSVPTWDAHGEEFRRHAERICGAFGWDSEVF